MKKQIIVYNSSPYFFLQNFITRPPISSPVHLLHLPSFRLLHYFFLQFSNCLSRFSFAPDPWSSAYASFTFDLLQYFPNFPNDGCTPPTLVPLITCNCTICKSILAFISIFLIFHRWFLPTPTCPHSSHSPLTLLWFWVPVIVTHPPLSIHSHHHNNNDNHYNADHNNNAHNCHTPTIINPYSSSPYYC